MFTCSSCKYFYLNHEDLPPEKRTGNHGLCHKAMGTPDHVEHKDSLRCAWYVRRGDEGCSNFAKEMMRLEMGQNG